MRTLWLALAAGCLVAGRVRAEEKPPDEKPPPPDTSEQEPVETDLHGKPPRTIRKDWNEYDFKVLTFKWGIFTILDAGTAAQTTESRNQIDVGHALKIRDFRFTFSGKFKTERPITYTMGLMYDGPSNSWFPRETGIQVSFPEALGHLFIGRQKLGISLNKISVGYAVWTMERMPMTDATVPIMTDGIKWLGGLPSKRANWNAAYFHNFLPKSPSTGWYSDSVALRFAYLPMLPEKEGALLHLGVGYHWGRYADGEAQLRARPESFTAPYFLDTGTFAANFDNLVSLEAYFRRDNWMVGAEYLFDIVRAPAVGNPLFHGGEAFVTWIITGETRPYIDLGGKMGFVRPKHSAFEGGTGALEAVLHFSYTDFDSKGVEGGRFWRLGPQLNWYLDSLVSLRVAYGLGHLDRFGVQEFTHFFQARLQLQID